VVACAATLGTVPLTLLGLAVHEAWKGAGADVWLLPCVAALFGATAMSFARRWRNARVLAYTSSCLLMVSALLMLFLVGAAGYDVSHSGVSIALAVGALALGGFTALTAYALKNGAA